MSPELQWQVQHCVNLPRVQTLQLELRLNTTANKKVRQSLLHDRNSWRCTCTLHIHVLNTSFGFVHRWSAQLTARPAGLASRRAIIHKKQLNPFSAFFQALKRYVIRVELSCLWNIYIWEICQIKLYPYLVRSAPVVKFT